MVPVFVVGMVGVVGVVGGVVPVLGEGGVVVPVFVVPVFVVPVFVGVIMVFPATIGADGRDSGEEPRELVALTVKVYVVLLVSPVRVRDTLIWFVEFAVESVEVAVIVFVMIPRVRLVVFVLVTVVFG